jgi:hypothetical protein
LQQPRQPGREAPADHRAEPERQSKATERPENERAVDEADHRVGEQVQCIARSRATLVVPEQPSHVRVHEAAQRSPPPDTVVDVRAVRFARPVGERVMLAVIVHP